MSAPETRIALPEKPSYLADPLPDLLKQRQELNWLIEHWLEQGTLALLVGAEGSFKSFLAIAWTMSIATNSDWLECRVSPGRVLYIAGEGRTGVIRRMRGWCDHHGIAADDVFLGRRALELVHLNEVELLEEYLRRDEWVLIVIDTLARNYGPGSENDAETMNAAIRNVDRIREKTGATVLIVHHAPLEGRDEGRLRPRGSSALSGAADAIFTCQYDKESKVVTVSNTKQKDAMPAESRFLSFDVVDLGDKDNFGNDITTIVLCPTTARPTVRKRLGKNQRRLIQHLGSRANGQAETIVVIRQITDELGIRNRQSRSELEDWFRDQPWVRASVGGHIVDLQSMPRI